LRNIKRDIFTAILVLSTAAVQGVYAQSSSLPADSTANQKAVGQISVSAPKPSECPSLKTFSNRSNPIGLIYAEDAINKTMTLMQNNRLTEAKAVIVPLADWLEDATEFHTNLYKALKDIDTAKSQADLERSLALKSAILRDKAIYQLSLLYIEEKNPKKAVPKLVDVVRSQPKTQLGFSAYQVLQQIGFTYKVQMITPEQAQSTSDQTVK